MVNDEIRKKIASLSPREKEVFELVCEGLTYKEITTKLHMSVSSVKTHMTAVRLKFGIDQLSRHNTTVELNNTYCSVLKEIQNESDKIKTTEKELKN
jgi:DNA-binding NarL/FixJ family response regulator